MAPIAVHLVQVALLSLSVFGVYATYFLANRNGTFDVMRDMRDNGPHFLPSTREPLRKLYTGVDRVDYQLQVLATFFWPIVTGDHPAATIQALNFGGQFAAAYVIVLIEGMRKGNRGRAVSYVLIWGLLYQNVAYAIAMPVCLAAHLLTGATTESTADILPFAAEVASIPTSITLGYTIPAILMALPFPTKVSSDQKQIYMALWQLFPVWIAVIQQVIKRVLGSSSSTLSNSSRAASVWALRFAYAFALGMAAMTHVSSIGLAGAYDLLPRLFNKDIEKYMGLRRTFVPNAYLPEQLMPNITEGAFLLLQWDEIVGSVAVLMWSVLMLIQSWPAKATWAGPLGVLSTAVFTTLVAGPVGCATALMWIRDEVIMERATEVGKKIQ